MSNAILSYNSFEPDSGQTGENAPMLVSQTTVVADMASREARLGLKPVYAVGDCHLRGAPLCKRARNKQRTDTTLNLCNSTDADCFAPGAPQFGLTKAWTASLAGAIFCHHELGFWACQPP